MAIHEHECRTYRGEPFNLQALKGQVLLIVNVASRCGFTPQLHELQRLYGRHRDRGLTVLAFPCNQFARQAPESAMDFCAFSSTRYGVTFPVMQKVKVNGSQAHSLFKELKREAPGVLGTTMIKWNFTKFLVGRDGRVIRRFAPGEHGVTLELALELALDET
ncbi:glutathione peroxidase [Halomonas sp. DQ26W]|uniref:glutathione peroxidase n=1 Tax=Halomonas sp. DQ26W TaxID=2282311 RepID=UPI000DF79D79|nr:glutathione peroxidase [Halomonas sp. DQ26W]RDB43616.1 glutathione peroxidase [Halomonas sp. DQ26W]